MAGSLAHITDDSDGSFRVDLIENLGDAYEALEECHQIIAYLLPLAGRSVDNSDATGMLAQALHDLNYPASATPVRYR